MTRIKNGNYINSLEKYTGITEKYQNSTKANKTNNKKTKIQQSQDMSIRLIW